jgi:hypothetical protein
MESLDDTDDVQSGDVLSVEIVLPSINGAAVRCMVCVGQVVRVDMLKARQYIAVRIQTMQFQDAGLAMMRDHSGALVM